MPRRNTSWNRKDRFDAIQPRLWMLCVKRVGESVCPPLSLKGDLGITKNYRSIIIAVIAAFLSYLTWIGKKSWETSEWPLKKSIHNFTVSDYPMNHRRSTCKKFQGNTVACRLLQGIRYHTQRKDGGNIISI